MSCVRSVNGLMEAQAYSKTVARALKHTGKAQHITPVLRSRHCLLVQVKRLAPQNSLTCSLLPALSGHQVVIF